MSALKDFYWEKSGGSWRVKWCPMGEGMVNWPKVFAGYAQAGFVGPVSIHMEYEPADHFAALAKDAEFVKRGLDAAYSARQS